MVVVVNSGSSDMAETSLVSGTRSGLFHLKGDVGFANARRLWKQGHTQLAGHKELEIDLSEVKRTDSAGVALLVAWAREAREHGNVVCFANIPEQIRAIADACGVKAILPFAEGQGNAPEDNQSRS